MSKDFGGIENDPNKQLLKLLALVVGVIALIIAIS